MRVVLDTSVLMSGIFFSGPPSKTLKAWADGRLKLIFSPDTLEEYYRVAENLRGRYPEVDITPVVELLTISAEIVSAEKISRPTCTDPDDDKFFTCTIAGRSSLIISGDKHLLEMSGFGGIRVVKPRAFMEKFLA